MPAVFCINGLAIGVGQTTFSLFNGAVSALLLRIPAAYILGSLLNWGLAGVGLAAPIATAGSLLVGVIYMFTGAWRKGRIRGVWEDRPATS